MVSSVWCGIVHKSFVLWVSSTEVHLDAMLTINCLRRDRDIWLRWQESRHIVRVRSLPVPTTLYHLSRHKPCSLSSTEGQHDVVLYVFPSPHVFAVTA